MTLPDDLAGRWGVVLLYRGHWCPYCRHQLIDFQRAHERLGELGAAVVALSVDPAEQAQQTVEKHQLAFPVLYEADATAVARATGAYINDDPAYLQATGFILRPDGTIALAVYSTGAIGRLVSADVVSLLQYLQQTPKDTPTTRQVPEHSGIGQ